MTLDRWGSDLFFSGADLLDASAQIAGGWRALYREKHECRKTAARLAVLSASEQKALMQRIMARTTAIDHCSPTVVFLVDGSGSVSPCECAI